MKTNIKILIALTLSVIYFNVKAQDIINDSTVIKKFEQGAYKLYESGKYTSLEDLSKQLSGATNPMKVTLKSKKNKSGCEYDEIRKSVLLIGVISKYDDSPLIYSNIASAFVISEDGVCVTNYHIFDIMGEPSESSLVLTTMDYQGNILPIEEVLCASEDDDIAIFKIKKGDVNLRALELSDEPAEVGEKISLISHPMNNFYLYAQGCVTRYYAHPPTKADRMATDVNFAQGSSGAPFYNKEGKVVGMVTATVPLVTRSRQLQMTIYETIPVSSIKRIIK